MFIYIEETGSCECEYCGYEPTEDFFSSPNDKRCPKCHDEGWYETDNDKGLMA